MNPKETMVYRELESRLKHYSGLSVWLSGNYDKTYWEPLFAQQQVKIDEIKRWAKKLPWGWIRHYYLAWIRWYYQPDLNGARRELRWKFEKRTMDRYYEKQQKRLDAISSFRENIPRPNNTPDHPTSILTAGRDPEPVLCEEERRKEKD